MFRCAKLNSWEAECFIFYVQLPITIVFGYHTKFIEAVWNADGDCSIRTASKFSVH